MATTVTLKPNAIDISGSTSGTTTLQATAVAGTTTITLPAATDTLVGKATTDTLTNKTLTTPTISSLSSASATALTLQSAGTTAITVDTSQNVGIGTTSPSSLLEISGSSAGGTITSKLLNTSTSANSDSKQFIYVNSATAGDPSVLWTVGGVTSWSAGIRNSDSDKWYLSPGSSLATTPAMVVDTSGNVGIGTTSQNEKLVVNGAVRSTNNAVSATATADSGVFYFVPTADAPSDPRTILQGVGTAGVGASIAFLTGTSASNSERMRIDSSGAVLVNTTSTSSQGKKLVVTDSQSGTNEGVIKFENSASSAGGRVITCNTNYAGTVIAFDKSNTGVGTISVTASNTAYNTSSDYRLKENIAPMTGALAKVALLKPVTFKWKIDGVNDEGFIAHELAEVKPNCVTGAKDATYEQEYEVTPAVKDQQGNITTPAVMGTRTVPAYQGVDTSFLVATLTAAIQETKALIDTQAETINALTARIVALEQA